MRLKVVAENWLERIALALRLAPTPIVETMQAVISARAIMAASRLGIFQTLGGGSLTAKELAKQNQLDHYAVEKLLGALVASRYVSFRRGRYGLTRMAKKWLVPQRKNSLHDNMQLRYLEWQAMERLEQFVTTGVSVDAHDVIADEEWEVYQLGMAALAGLAAHEVAQRIPLPSDPQTMLDIGGAHGQYATAICKRVPTLHATVLELPSAIHAAKRAFEKSGGKDELLAQRVQYQAGDALQSPWGQTKYDLVFISQLIHHFSEAENRSLVRSAAAALRKGGTLVIVDAIRPAQPNARCQTGQMLDLFFAVTSKSGTWPVDQIQDWQSSAGLRLQSPVPIRTLPGVVMVSARKDFA